jgi:hypothetical protein
MNEIENRTKAPEATSSPTRLSTIGMDRRQRNALRTIFSSQCNNRFILTEEASCEICILDLDAPGGDEKLKEFRERHPNWPLIVVSANHHELSDHDTTFIRKPIPVEELIVAVDSHRIKLSSVDADTDPIIEDPVLAPVKPAVSPHRATSHMSASQERVFVGTSPDIDTADPEQVKKIYYTPEHYLQGLAQQALNQAVRYNQNIKIEGPWPDMILDIVNNKMWVSANNKQLRPYCTMPDTTLEVQLRPVKTDWTPPANATEHPLQAFIWQLALWASRGRIPRGTSLSQPIYLRHWPNFTRLVVTPYAMPIAALWIKQPRSLIDTSDALNIPQRYVFAFYSAARSLQLAGEARRAVDTLIAPPAVEKSQFNGLFGNLLGRLRGSKNNHE